MFTGYTDQTVDVFWGIRFNNERAWFAEHKQEFQDAVMTPTKALAGDLYDWFQEAYPDLHLNVHISRIYRDARRLFGRGPLNDHIWFSFQNAIENRGEAPCFWFQVGADGYGCGAGWWMPAASGVQLRRLLDNDPKRAEKLLRQLDAQQLDLVILENVGNLVCPAEFDTGAHTNLMILSVPEGHDKPLKYPLIFQKCDAMIVSKLDVLPYFDFDLDQLTQYARLRNPDIQIFPVSAKTGEGLPALADWLIARTKQKREKEGDAT